MTGDLVHSRSTLMTAPSSKRSPGARPCRGIRSAAPARSWRSPRGSGPRTSPPGWNATSARSAAPVGVTTIQEFGDSLRSLSDRARPARISPLRRAQIVELVCLERRLLASQFAAAQFDRGEQGGQAAHPALQGRSGALADAEGGQLGIDPGPLRAPAFGRACLGAAIDRGDPNDRSPQEAEPQPPRLRGASRSITAAALPLFSGSARSPEDVASARRLAVIWSARARKWSWISTST